MAKKKKIVTQMGRPVNGVLSDFDSVLKQRIKRLRKQGGKWGAEKIRMELVERYNYSESELPSRSSITRFLREQKLVATRPSRSDLVSEEEREVHHLHDLWEMDAQGSVLTPGGDYISPINVKDYKSGAHCVCFPVPTKSSRGKANCEAYLWALRYAFECFGIPKRLQVDKDSVFIDTRSASPFPLRFHLYLVGLGIKVLFIKFAPPRRQARVERSHQTMDNWVFKQRGLSDFRDYWQECQRTVRQYNETFKSATTQGETRLKKHPELYKNTRTYSIKTEHKIWCMKRVKKYLSKHTFYRVVAGNTTISLGGKVYSLRGAEKGKEVRVKYNRKKHKFMVRQPASKLKWQLDPKGLDKLTIIGHTQQELNKINDQFNSSKSYPLGTT